MSEETFGTIGSAVSSRRVALPLLYLALIVAAEVLTNFFDLAIGLIAHTVILAGLLVHSSLATKSSNRQLLVTLSLAPLTRIMSLSMPLTRFPAAYWYLIIYPSLFLAGLMVVRNLGFSARDIGVTVRKLPVQLAVALSGIIFGIAEYLLLRPGPLVVEAAWGQVLLALVALMAGTGFVEEFIFRGVIQRAATTALGSWGMPYVAFLFAVLHLIHYSNNPWDIPFVFLVGLFFGWVVNKTGSLLGVTLSHGITNTIVYLIIPFLS